MYGKTYEIENLEEQVQELESKQENALAELDYALELLEPIGVDGVDYQEYVSEAIKAIKNVMKELK